MVWTLRVTKVVVLVQQVVLLRAWAQLSSASPPFRVVAAIGVWVRPAGIAQSDGGHGDSVEV